MRIGRRRRTGSPVRSRLTKAGWVFVVACVVVAIVAMNSGLALLFLMLGAMVGAVYVSWLLARRMVAAARVRRDVPARCRQNQRVSLGYLLRSVRGGGACLALRIEELDARAAALEPAACGYLPARGGVLAHSETTPRRRGRIRLRRLRLSTTFPFGLIASARQSTQEASLVVWPARGRLVAALLGKGEAESADVAPSIRSGGQDEFYGLREYRLGDNARWIHWRRSAGRGEPVIREMARPRPRTVWVVLDTYLPDASPPVRAARERAIRFAATLIEDALAGGYRVGAALAYDARVVVVSPADRRTQKQRLLDALADIDDNAVHRLPDAIARLRPAWLRQAHVVVISAAEAEESLTPETLARLRRDSRNLTLAAGARIGGLFRDNELAAREDA